MNIKGIKKNVNEVSTERYFNTFLYGRLDRVALELLLLFCTFEDSTQFSKILFDRDSFQNS